MLEVTIAVAIVSTVLMAAVGAFGSSLAAVEQARRASRGAVLLQTVMEDLAAQPYSGLLTFNGNHVFDHTSASNSNYSVDLTVFQSAVDLRQIQAVLTDLRTGRELGRATTLRSNR